MQGNYEQLKADIAAVIKTNGNNEITGQLLQQVLRGMVTQIGANLTISGIATPATQPGSPDQRCCYFATAAGTYANFDGRVLNGTEMAIFFNSSGSWHSWTLPIATESTPTHVVTMAVGGQADYTSDDVKAWNDTGDIVLMKYGGTYLTLSQVVTNAGSTFALFSGVVFGIFNDNAEPQTMLLTLDNQGYATYTSNQPVDYLVKAVETGGAIVCDRDATEIIQAVINGGKTPVVRLTSSQLPGIGTIDMPLVFYAQDATFATMLGGDLFDDMMFSVVLAVHTIDSQSRKLATLNVYNNSQQMAAFFAQKLWSYDTIPAGGLLPNVLYDYGTTDSVTITLAAGETGVANIWMFTFTAQSSACSVTLPQGVSLGNEYAWEFAAGRKFEVSIMNGIAIVNYVD